MKSIIQKRFINLIDLVVIGKDSNLMNDSSADIQHLCESHNISFCHRENEITIHSPYTIAISWRWLLHLDQSRLIVLHDSILPKYRGFAPLVNQLIKGEKKIGVTALWASSEYDKGDIIAQETVDITYPIKIGEAIEKIAPLYGNLTCIILEKINKEEKITSVCQLEKEASYSLWRDKEDYRISWSDSAENISRFIHAVGYPYEGAEALVNGEIVKIFDCETVPDVNVEIRQIGKVIFISDGCPVIVCGRD